MNKPLSDKDARAIQEEIRTRVFEKYAETQGVQTQEHELRATLEALHEITQIPLSDIEKIAAEVTQEYQISNVPIKISQQQLRHLAPPTDFTFEKLVEKVKRKKRSFTPHFIAYACVHIPLIYLNIISTSFPWVIFPMLGWGIGLVIHYFAAVRWPAIDLRNKIRFLKSQIHQILQENVPVYRTDVQSKIFSGVYRLVVMEGSQETMNEYLRNVDPGMSDHEVKQVTTQLCSLRNKYIKER